MNIWARSPDSSTKGGVCNDNKKGFKKGFNDL